MKRKANAHWAGSIKEGKGNLSTASGILEQTNYSFKTRFQDEEKGTNPEELLAAAHAGCFTMSVSYALTEIGLEPKLLDTEAIVTMDASGITGIALSITADVANISLEAFKNIVLHAEKNCLISKILNVPITSQAQLLN